MSLTVDILRKLDEFGLEDVLTTYSKEDIDDAIKAETKDEVKAQLKLMSKNWRAAEEAFGAIKKLAEIVTNEDDDFETEIFSDDEWDEDTDDWDGSYDDEEEEY